MTAETITLRAATDADSPAIIARIDACYRDYPGCILCVDEEEPQLKAVASHFAAAGGQVWVAERNGAILGSIAYAPDGETAWLKNLYVAREARGAGLARRLCALVFEAAHRLYEKLGFIRGPETRSLNDKSRTVEYFYRMAVSR